MTLKEIKAVYKVISSNGKFSLFDKFDYLGYLTKDNTKFYFHGDPDKEPIRVKNIDELKITIENFLKECEDNWINPKAFDPSIVGGYAAELALSYLVNKIKLSHTDKMNTGGYVLGDKGFGTKALTIDSNFDYKNGTCSFYVNYNAGWFTTSPDFNNYKDAMSWLKAIISQVSIAIGIEYLSMSLNNGLMNSKMEEVTMNAINYSNFSVEKASLNDHLIAILEEQLKILKESK